jgi:NitT/TauT family transport system permease protein
MSRAGWLRLLLLALAVGLLEVACRLEWIDKLTVVPPSAMAVELAKLFRTGEIWPHITESFRKVVAAFALSVAGGLLGGVIVHAIPRLRRVVDPLLASYFSVPFFIFYPLFIVLLGLNDWPLIAIAFMFAAVAMMVNVLNGLDRIPRVLIKVARVHRLDRARLAWLILLPAAAPHLFTGVKLALAYSFVGVLACEFIMAGSGLGYSIAFAYDNFKNATMYALVAFVLLTVTFINVALHLWEQRILRRRARA